LGDGDMRIMIWRQSRQKVSEILSPRTSRAW
jgi:hypothetical protein